VGRGKRAEKVAAMQSSNKMRILITGGSGLLALSWALAARDRYAVTLGLHEREVSLAGVQVRKMDLESIDNLLRVFDTVQPQIVIHTAGLTSVERSEAEPSLAHHINVVLASNVARACASLGLGLVHISTDHLFHGEMPLVAETCPVAPRNVYGKTKAEAESRVLDAHPQALVIRTNFYGWGPNYRHSFSDVIIRGLRVGKELTLFQDVFYTPILAEVLAQVVSDLVDLNASGLFHVVGDERLSKYEFGLKVAEGLNLDASLIKPVFIKHQSALVQRPNDMSLSNRKACELLGRKFGGVDDHLVRLRQQEIIGLAREIRIP